MMKWFVFLILSGVFLLTPYAKGLYFDHQFYGIQVVLFFLFLIFAIYLFVQKKVGELQSVWIFLLLPLCYLMSLVVAESPKGAIDSSLRWITYSVFFLMLFWVSFEKRIQSLFPVIFQLTGVWMSIAMMLFYYRMLDFHHSVVAERFAGVFQYPNTFGMVMGAFYLFSVVMLTREKLPLWVYVLYSFPLVGFISNILLSYSRGVFLLLPIIWFIGLFLFQAKQQVRYVLLTILSVVFSIPAYMTISTDHVAYYENTGLFIVSFMTILFVITSRWITRLGLDEKMIRLLDRLPQKLVNYTIPLTMLFIGLLGYLDIINQGLVYKQLPENVQARVTDMNLETNTAKERGIFAKDAITISVESPVLGHGGGAWKVLNKNHQSLPYASNKIHNGYLEWLVDNGWVGLLVFFGVLLYFYQRIIRIMLSNRGNLLVRGTFLVLTMIFIHSLIDFNFSFGTVWFMIVWLLTMGIMNEAKKDLKHHRINLAILATLSIVVLISSVFSYRFMHGYQFFQKAKAEAAVSKKEHYLYEAMALDPYETKYLLELGGVYSRNFSKLPQPETNEKLENVLGTLYKLEPNHSVILYQIGAMHEATQNTDDAIVFFEKGLAIDRYHALLYEKAIELKVKRVQVLEEVLTQEIEQEILDSVIEHYLEYEKWYQFYEENKPANSQDAFNSRDFTITNSAKYHTAFAYYLKGDFSKTSELLSGLESSNPDDSLDIAALKYVAFMKTKQGKKAHDILVKFEGDKSNLLKEVEKLEKKDKE